MTDRVANRTANWGNLNPEKDKTFLALSWEERMDLVELNEATLERAFHRLDDVLFDELSHLVPLDEVVSRHTHHTDTPPADAVSLTIVPAVEAAPAPPIDIIDEVTVFSSFVRESLASEGIIIPPVTPETLVA